MSVFKKHKEKLVETNYLESSVELTYCRESAGGAPFADGDKLRAGDCSSEMKKGLRIIKVHAARVITYPLRVQFQTQQSRSLKFNFQLKGSACLVEHFTLRFIREPEVQAEMAKQWAFSFEGDDLQPNDTYDSLIKRHILDEDDRPEDGFMFDVRWGRGFAGGAAAARTARGLLTHPPLLSLLPLSFPSLQAKVVSRK